VHHEEQQLSLEQFVAERGDRLLRTAALLAGSRADGEDLLQSALERLLRNWRRIDGDPESYVRRTLYNLATDGWRRQRVWRQKAALFEPAPPVDPAAGVDLPAAAGGAGPAPPAAAGRPGTALLRAAERGGNGGKSRLLGRHRQVGHRPRAGPAT
jgi:DNA-directed RNA polymerase specialized sigma24 family protein